VACAVPGVPDLAGTAEQERERETSRAGRCVSGVHEGEGGDRSGVDGRGQVDLALALRSGKHDVGNRFILLTRSQHQVEILALHNLRVKGLGFRV
jgi:hypothetical protein